MNNGRESEGRQSQIKSGPYKQLEYAICMGHLNDIECFNMDSPVGLTNSVVVEMVGKEY